MMICCIENLVLQGFQRKICHETLIPIEFPDLNKMRAKAILLLITHINSQERHTYKTFVITHINSYNIGNLTQSTIYRDEVQLNLLTNNGQDLGINLLDNHERIT